MMLRRILGMARGRAMGGGTGAARPGVGGSRSGPARRGQRPGHVIPKAGAGDANTQRRLRSLFGGLTRRR